MKRHILVSSALLLATLFHLSGKEKFIYTQISRNEGFTSTVNCIYKENHGDVWLGTPNGLYHFNGYTLNHYEDSLLADKSIFRFNEDKNGNIWILTDDWPIYRKKGSKSYVYLRPDGATEKRAFRSICQDDEGIWLGSDGKLFRYTYADKSFKLFKTVPTYVFRNISLLDSKTLLCTSYNGVIFIDTETGDVRNVEFGSHKEVSASLIDSKGNIWLALFNNGIEVYTRNGELINSYNTANSELSNNIVLCMTERDGAIWVGTDGGGVNIIDAENNKINILSHVAGDQASFPAQSIKCIYTDADDNIWAGSIRNGLISISVSEMITYSDSHIGLKTGLSNPTVLCLFQDSSSRYIWIGTDGEGLNRFDPKTREFVHYPSTLKTKVVSIAEYSRDELLLSLYSDRAILFDKRTGDTRPLKIDDSDLSYRIKYADRYINLVNEKNGDILFIGNIINRLNRSTGGFSRIPKEQDSPTYVIGKTDKGTWLHDSSNIYLLRPGESLLETIGQLENGEIRCGDIDDSGNIWLATDRGLCRFDKAAGAFTDIPTTLFKDAITVVCDNNSRIWVSTEQNIFAYLTESDNFAMFGESDGAAPNEYLSRSRLFSREGDTYIGGVQGLLCIDNGFTIETSEVPKVKLYEITADGDALRVGKNGLIVVPRDCKSLELSISTKEKDIFRNKRFRYEFSNGGPTFEKTVPTLKIQQLPKPGKYNLLVSCTKRNGKWTEPTVIASVKIPYPWYLSWAFLGSMACLIIIIIGTILVSMAYRKNNRLQLALKEQEQRTYEEKVRMLINVSHELRTPLTLIMAPLKRLLKDADPNDENTGTLNRIHRQSLRMRDMLNMVLDLRKLEEGNNSLQLESVDFNDWILEGTKDVVSEEHSEGIDIVFDTDDNISTVELDKRKCDTVLMNILINAVKHSSTGDAITVRTELIDGMVRTSVSDQGPGLGDIDQEILFARFYQSNNEKYGSGIGLSYSKILVELHGGRIGAYNNMDKGATFWWEIPVCGIESAIQTKAYINELMGYDNVEDVDAPEQESFSTAKMSLMLVDDNRDLLDFLKEALASEFSEVMTLSSGNKAYGALEEGKIPDIIVSDVNMPDGDGYRLCKTLKESDRYSHIPIILLTARGEEQSQGDSYRLGADGFMAKPFEVETLLEFIRNILKKKAEIRKQYLDMSIDGGERYGSNEEKFVLQLNRVISDNLSNTGLDQQLICRELGVSRALLYSKMKSIIGMGTSEYINKLRLEKAKSLIENSDLSIIEVSEMTGFTSQSYFSTAFKAYTGITPTQYKKGMAR